MMGVFYTTFQLGADILCMLDIDRGLALYWCRDAQKIPAYERSAPIRTLIHWWMREHNRQLIHGGAVGTATGGVLLVGRGGSGKSTTALACLDAGFSYVSDDYCLVASRPTPYVYSLYNSAKLKREDIDRFPNLAPAIQDQPMPQMDKAVFWLHNHCPEKIEIGFPVHAILWPQVTSRALTSVRETSAATGLRALAASTIFQLPGAGQQDFQNMIRLVKEIPNYVLELGSDITEIPNVVGKLLDNKRLVRDQS